MPLFSNDELPTILTLVFDWLEISEIPLINKFVAYTRISRLQARIRSRRLLMAEVVVHSGSAW